MQTALIALGIYAATCAVIWLGCHFGGKWIDRMLCVPPMDPSKPIVLPTPPASEPPEWFKKIYGEYLQSEEGRRLYGNDSSLTKDSKP